MSRSAICPRRGLSLLLLGLMALLFSSALPGGPAQVLAATGDIVEFAIPATHSAPTGITSGPDGNLWFAEAVAGKIGRITPGGAVAEFALPTGGSGPAGIASGPDGNLWFTEAVAGKIGRITPAGIVVEFAVPTANSGPLAIARGPGGDLWFTESAGNKIGRVAVAPLPTVTPTPTNTANSTPTPTNTPTNTPTATNTWTAVPTVTPTVTTTPTRTPTATNTPTTSPTVTPTVTPTNTAATATPCTANVIQNGGFETGSLAPWVMRSFDPPPSISPAAPHTGTYSVLLGGPGYPLLDSAIYQTIIVPPGGGTLSYWWLGQTTSTITSCSQDAYITDTSGNILATIMHNCQTNRVWFNETYDMAAFAGQTVRIEFLVHQLGYPDETSMYVDDVQLLNPLLCASPTVTSTATATNTPNNTPTSTATPTATLSYRASVLADGPSIYYRLGDTAGSTAVDSSGRGRDGVYSGGVTLRTGGAIANDLDTAVTLDGNTGYVQYTAGSGLPTSNAPRTVEIWFKTVTAPAVLWGYGDGGVAHAQLEVLLAAQSVNVESSGAELMFGLPHGSLTDGAWHYLAVVYDGSQVTVYVDGAADGAPQSFGFALTTTLDDSGLVLGRANGNGGPQYFFDGSLDEAAIYPAALSSGQISAHYMAGRAP